MNRHTLAPLNHVIPYVGIILASVCFMFSGTFAAAQAQSTSLISTNRDNSDSGNQLSAFIGNTAYSPQRNDFSSSVVSPDGRFVVFYSAATNLVPEPVSGEVWQVYVRDRLIGTTKLVSVTFSGMRGGNQSSRDPAISADGRYVVFVSDADDLVIKDTNDKSDVFVRDLLTGTTSLVSVNRAGTDSGEGTPTLPNGGPLSPFFHSYWPLMSTDGRRVVFLSYADNLVENDTNNAQDLFVRDLQAGETKCISVNRAGVPTGNRTSISSSGFFFFYPALSADGRFVAFESWNNDLVDNDSVCVDSCNGTNGFSDVFVRDLVNDRTTLVSINRAGTNSGNSGSSDSRLSADGRFVAFRSNATDLTANDSTPQADVYVRDLMNGVTTLVSVNRAGTNGGGTGSSGVNHYFPLISADGRFVVFSGWDKDVAANKIDISSMDVFVRDTAAGLTTLVSVNRNGNDNGRAPNTNSIAQHISGDGRYIVFISSANDIVANDNNGSLDDDRDIFVRDLAIGTTIPLSLNLSGVISSSAGLGQGRISADGRTLVFEDLASDLVANDTNSAFDIFARLAHPAYPINDAQFFVQQHYRDFLNREADDAGLQFWRNEITSCGDDAQCIEVKRINVSAAFFLAIEFQETGYFVYRMHQAAFNTGERLRRRDLLPDMLEVARGVRVGQPGWELQLKINKAAYASSFAARHAFSEKYPTTMSNAQYVDALNVNTGGSLSPVERDALVGRLNAGQLSRADALWEVAEDADFVRREFNRAFVLMQYVGYLRRNPDDPPDHNFDGYNFWLSKLNQFNGDFAASEMVKAFITSGEYRARFNQ